jgi:alkanesulfonate monooxygenase SsuD/methylene tetrahydromethanopterin reductase-like flavin-dependent oxidoreductase (luciferase family)
MEIVGRALGFDTVADARAAEAAGYDGVRVIDHFFSGIPPATPVAVPHSFVSIGAAAVATDRVLLTQTMIAATIRHPAEVAQAVACLDRLSAGRAELGLGAGWLIAEHEAMGLDLGPPAERVRRLVEAATICRHMFANGGCVDFDGEIFRAHSDAEWPPTPHVPEVMVGAHGPRLLREAAVVADRIDLLEAMVGGRPRFDGPDANDEVNLATRMALARESAHHAGRDVRFSATVNLVVRPDAAGRDEARRDLQAAAGCGRRALDRELLRVVATDGEALDRFVTLGSIGVDRVHVRPADPWTQQWLDGAVPEIRAIA